MTSSLESDIEDFLAAAQLERGLSANTCTGYGLDLRLFAGYLKRRSIVAAADVRRDDIVDFLANEREKGRRGSTRSRRTAAIRSFFRFLKERHRLPVDPSALMDAPKKAKVLPRVLSEEETFRMLDAVKDEGLDIKSM